jgi:hypothetical protein
LHNEAQHPDLFPIFHETGHGMAHPAYGIFGDFKPILDRNKLIVGDNSGLRSLGYKYTSGLQELAANNHAEHLVQKLLKNHTLMQRLKRKYNVNLKSWEEANRRRVADNTPAAYIEESNNTQAGNIAAALQNGTLTDVDLARLIGHLEYFEHTNTLPGGVPLHPRLKLDFDDMLTYLFHEVRMNNLAF